MSELDEIRGDMRSVYDTLRRNHSYDWEGVIDTGVLNGSARLYCPDGAVYDFRGEKDGITRSLFDFSGIFVAKLIGMGHPRAISSEALNHLENHPKYAYPNEKVFGELETAFQLWKKEDVINNQTGCLMFGAALFWAAYGIVHPSFAKKRLYRMKERLEEQRRQKVGEVLNHLENAFELGYFPNWHDKSQLKYHTLIGILDFTLHPDNEQVRKVMECRSKSDSSLPLLPKKEGKYEVRIEPDALIDLWFDSAPSKREVETGRVDKEYWLGLVRELRLYLPKLSLDVMHVGVGPTL